MEGKILLWRATVMVALQLEGKTLTSDQLSSFQNSVESCDQGTIHSPKHKSLVPAEIPSGTWDIRKGLARMAQEPGETCAPLEIHLEAEGNIL